MIRRRFKLLRTHTSTSPSSGGIDGSSSSSSSIGSSSVRSEDDGAKTSSTTTQRTASRKIFRRGKSMVVSGRDVLFSKESDKASNVSNKDTAAAAGGTRRRQPPPDGYLYDVSKTKDIQHMMTKKKSTAPSRNALDRGNHYQVERDISSLTEQDLLFDGLRFVAYDEVSVKQVNVKENVERFKSFYGVAPSTLLPFMKDLKEAHPHMYYRNVMMTCNFLKGDEVKRCMEPRWGRNKTYIGRTVREYTKMFASLKYLKIKMDIDESDAGIIVYTVDGVNFATSEFRKDPSTKWFDHKSHNSGLKYEFAVSLKESKLLWINGPYPASVHDITIYRGKRTKDQKQEDWDRNSLFFIVPDGVLGIADDGYRGEQGKIVTSRAEHSSEMRSFLARAKNRQESLHSRLKSFNILKNCFRHGRATADRMQFHKECVHAICVLVQYDMENGHPLFEV